MANTVSMTRIKCRRRESCEFSHKGNETSSDILKLEAKVESLKSTVAEIQVKIDGLEQELNNIKTPNIEVNNDTSAYFKCEKCGYVCKREATLGKHINPKHQLDDEEVYIVIQNDSNDRELKKANRLNKELEEKVEHLALGKARLECEASHLRTESDSLKSLIFLRQSIDTHVPGKQTPKKKKK